MLDEIAQAGEKVYNGRARRTIETLVSAGYIEADWDLWIRSGGDAAWRITVRLTDDIDLTGAGEKGLGLP